KRKNQDLKELINENEDKPVEVAIEVIEKWEKDAKDFSEALDTAEE
ncbi:3623_t:CDS:2, partial [Entrophospora sp. SA101]